MGWPDDVAPRTSTRPVPSARSVLAVCAHPDDESFGLGAVLAGFAESGTDLALLCFTRGEASTLGAGPALSELRRVELTRAAAALGVGRLEVSDHPDGALSSEPLGRLEAEVTVLAGEVAADLLVVFDEGGVTGHPDHCRATEAALTVARASRLPALAWTIPRRVAEALNAEFGTSFVGRPDGEIDLVLTVDRVRQWRAIAAHTSQCDDNPVLERRLTLLGEVESLRWLHSP